MTGTAQSNSPLGLASPEKVRRLQNRLWAAAKQSEDRRFHALFDRIYRSDVLWEAWSRVRANRGAAGVDALTTAAVEDDYGVERLLAELQGDLRAGIYHPVPVRRVEIPKPDGRLRPLGIPTIRDRVAQQAAKIVLEPLFEADFLPCSFGFRPKRSATDAMEAIRVAFPKGQQFVFEADITNFFGEIDHEKLLSLVEERVSDRRVLKLLRQWLRAGVLSEGVVTESVSGTPQGSPISPLLANLFMHYAFDRWMDRKFPGCPFERYADDIVVHCDTEEQARLLRASIASRLGALGLELHPEKTKVVYCKDGHRRGNAEHTSFDFLGYTFRARSANSRQGLFVGFLPAMSQHARKAVGQKIRAWHLNRRTGTTLSDLAREINAQVRGWINYYGAFYRSELYSLAMRINEHLVRWAMQKFKRLRGQPTKAWAWLDAVRQHQPGLFAHWHMLPLTSGRPVGAG